MFCVRPLLFWSLLNGRIPFTSPPRKRTERMPLSSMLASAKEVHEALQSTSPPRILDASWRVMHPQVQTSPRDDFSLKRIPGASLFDHDLCCDMASWMPMATPSPEDFAEYMSSLGGISRDTPIVVYESAANFECAPRCLFLLKLFGHTDVRMLYGGLPAWVAAGYPIESGIEKRRPPLEYTVQAETPNMQQDVALMLKNLKTQRRQVIDVRDPDYFAGRKVETLYHQVNGRVVELHDKMRPGRIPGSKNLPCVTAMLSLREAFEKGVQSSEGGRATILEPAAHCIAAPQDSVLDDALRAKLDLIGVDLDQPVAVVCTGGSWQSSLLMMLLRARGTDAVIMKDGMGAWSHARGGALPMISDDQEPQQLNDLANETRRSRSPILDRSLHSSAGFDQIRHSLSPVAAPVRRSLSVGMSMDHLSSIGGLPPPAMPTTISVGLGGGDSANHSAHGGKYFGGAPLAQPPPPIQEREGPISVICWAATRSRATAFERSVGTCLHCAHA